MGWYGKIFIDFYLIDGSFGDWLGDEGFEGFYFCWLLILKCGLILLVDFKLIVILLYPLCAVFIRYSISPKKIINKHMLPTPWRPKHKQNFLTCILHKLPQHLLLFLKLRNFLYNHGYFYCVAVIACDYVVQIIGGLLFLGFGGWLFRVWEC